MPRVSLFTFVSLFVFSQAEAYADIAPLQAAEALISKAASSAKVSGLSDVAVESHGDSVGLKTKREFKKGAPILCYKEPFTPQAAIQGTDLKSIATSGGLLKWIADGDSQRNSLIVFALWFMRIRDDSVNEKAGAARWKAWVDTWPGGENLPYTWPSKIRELIGFQLTEHVPDVYDEVKKTFLSVNGKVFGNPLRRAYSRDAFRRALALMYARAHFSAEHGTVLFPILDLAAHHESALPLTYVKASGTCIVAASDLLPGSQVAFRQHDSNTRSTLLRVFDIYGELPEDPTKDSLDLMISVPEGVDVDRLYPGVCDIGIMATADDPTSRTCVASLDRKGYLRALPLLRLVAFESAHNGKKDFGASAHIERALCKEFYSHRTACGISRANELEALGLLRRKVEQLLDTATEVENDEQALRDKKTADKIPFSSQRLLIGTVRRRLMDVAEFILEDLDLKIGTFRNLKS